ncbi:hypothetical protein [Nocardia sp. NPDC004722]
MEPEALRRSARMSQAGAEHEQSRIAGRGLDPDYIHDLEHFPALSHERIHDSVQAMNPGDMHRAAEHWISLADSVFGALTTLHATVQAALSDGMSGAMADAADLSARRFITDATDLADITTATGHRILAAAYGAEALRKTVPPPEPHASPNIREELHQIALAALDANYTPIYPPAGSHVPAFFTVRTPAAGDVEPQADNSSGPAASNPRMQESATMFPAANRPSDSRNMPSTAQTERTTSPESAAAQDIPSAPTTAADSGSSTGQTSKRASWDGRRASAPPRDGTETSPASVNPDDTPLSTTARPAPTVEPSPEWPHPNPATPRSVAPAPGSVVPAPGSTYPDPGRSYPGPADPAARTQPNLPLPSLPDSPAAATSPAMFAPGNRATTAPDSLHHSPAWLIRDRQSELLGHPLPHVPPTLGAEFPSARYDLTPPPTTAPDHAPTI